MKRDFLEALGIEKDVIDKIMAENGKDINAAKGEFATLQQELESTKEQLKTANGTIEGFGDVEAIKAQVAEYRTKWEASEAEKANIKTEYAFNGKLEGMAKKYGAKALKAVTPYLDTEALKKSNNQDADIEAAFKKLKEAEDTAFLFGSDEPIHNPVGGSGRPAGGGTLSAVARAMGLTEKDI